MGNPKLKAEIEALAERLERMDDTYTNVEVIGEEDTIAIETIDDGVRLFLVVEEA